MLVFDEELDIKRIIEVYKDSEDFLSLGPESKASREMVEKDLIYSKENNYTFFEIKLDNNTIGVCDYCISGFEGTNNGYINLIMIKRNERSKGYGSIVIKRIEDKIRESGSTGIIAFVQINNSIAVKFWKKQGYKRKSGRIYNEDTTVVYRLEKKITEKKDR